MNKLEQFGLWWPDFETAAEEVQAYMIGRVTDVDVVTKHVRTKGIAVQAGGHVGLWPRQLAKHFAFVHTFEPCPDMFECLSKNVDGYRNILPQQCALGEKIGIVGFAERRSGRSKIDVQAGDYNVAMRTLDSMRLPRCDLLYLDLEGYETQALAGATTLLKFKPVVVLEVLKGNKDAIEQWAERANYERVERIHNDWVFLPK